MPIPSSRSISNKYTNDRLVIDGIESPIKPPNPVKWFGFMQTDETIDLRSNSLRRFRGGYGHGHPYGSRVLGADELDGQQQRSAGRYAIVDQNHRFTPEFRLGRI